MKKGAIELSMSTIIVIIIGITLLTLALIWVKGYFSEIDILTQGAFDRAKEEIQNKMSGDEKFYISQSTLTLKVGGSTELYVGIQNFEGVKDNFGVRFRSETAKVEEWVKDLPPTMAIDAGEKKGFPILIKAPKTSKPGDSNYFVVEAYKGEAKETYNEQLILIKVI